jgi:hypothetical protein
VEELLDESELAVAADERRLEAGRLLRAAARGGHSQCTVDRHRFRLPLQLVLAGGLVGDRRLGRAPRRLADEDGPGLGNGLDARGSVDEVARDHPLAFDAERDRRLAGEHPTRAARLPARSGTASTRSSAARTARSASSSFATSVLHTAITASPMNFSTVPPYTEIRRSAALK